MFDFSFLLEVLLIVVGVFILSFVVDVVFAIVYVYTKNSSLRQKERVQWREFQVRQEMYGEQMYWYDAETGHFLAQGKNHDEIMEKMKLRFPEKVFEITK